MSIDTFLFLLMTVSVFTVLFTQGIKKLMDDLDIGYSSNIVAGAVSVALSMIVGSAYPIVVETEINAKMAVMLIALVLLSWLSAMVGYDKVVQAIAQIRNGK